MSARPPELRPEPLVHWNIVVFVAGITASGAIGFRFGVGGAIFATAIAAATVGAVWRLLRNSTGSYEGFILGMMTFFSTLIAVVIPLWLGVLLRTLIHH